MTVITQQRTARKPHHCERCHATIQPGEPYVRHALTPNDREIGNPRWWVLCQHADDNYKCLAASGSL
jgi:hypothetical protein